MNTEEIIKSIVSSAHSVSQKGDISKHLYEQGFFNGGPLPRSLKQRDNFLSGGNPVDTLSDFNKQQHSNNGD